GGRRDHVIARGPGAGREERLGRQVEVRRREAVVAGRLARVGASAPADLRCVIEDTPGHRDENGPGVVDRVDELARDQPARPAQPAGRDEQKPVDDVRDSTDTTPVARYDLVASHGLLLDRLQVDTHPGSISKRGIALLLASLAGGERSLARVAR